jgi:hypothetical protein
MTPEMLPQPLLAKLFALQSHVEACRRAAADAERARDDQRAALNDRHPRSMREHRDKDGWNLATEQQKLETLIQQAAGFRQIAATEAEILKRCNSWIEGLPAVSLEPVNIKLADSDNIASVRARLAAITAELKLLQSAPTPGDDLRNRIQAYVSELSDNAYPEIQGIGQGETLRVYWPAEPRASRRNLNGFDTALSNGLLMFAWLEPARLVDHLVAVANCIGDQHGPAAERPQRIASLQDEILPLRYAEEALICRMLAAGDAVVRDPNAPVEAVLQVKIRDAKPKSSPAMATKSAELETTVGVSP